MIEGRLLRRTHAMKAHRVKKLKQEIRALSEQGMSQERIAVLANCSQPYVSFVLS